MRNIPKLRFREFTDEYIYNYIGAFSSQITSGGTPSTKKVSYWLNGTIPWMSSGEVNKRILTDTDKYITEEGLSNSSTKIIQNKSVLMALAGQGKTRGMVAVNEISLCTNQSIGIIEVDNKYQDYKYLYYNLLREYQKLRIWSSTGEGRGGINLKFISDWKLHIPLVDEQRKVSEFLSIIDNKINLIEKKIKNLKLFKRGIVQLYYNNRNNLKMYKISDLFRVTRGNVIPRSKLTEDKQGDSIYPCYSSKSINEGLLGYTNSYLFSGNLLTWTTDGANAGKVFYRDNLFYCTNVCGVLIPHNDEFNFASEYLSEYLNLVTHKYVSYVGNPKLMNNIMSNISVELPSLSTVSEYSKNISKLNSMINILEDKLNHMRLFKKGLLQQMFV